MMLISKMRSVFVLGYPQTPTRVPLGELRGARGVEINKPQKIKCDISILGFSIVGILKMRSVLLLG